MTWYVAGLAVGLMVFWTTDAEFRRDVRATLSRWWP